MATEIRVPALGESVTEATVGQWFKQSGETVNADEPVVELETDKVTIEVPAPAAGVLSDVAVQEGDTVEVGAVLGAIQEGEGKAEARESEAGEKADAKAGEKAEQSGEKPEKARQKAGKKEEETGQRADRKEMAEARSGAGQETKTAEKPAAGDGGQPALSPAVRKLIDEHGLDPSGIEGTGKAGRILKEDVLKEIEEGDQDEGEKGEETAPEPSAPLTAPSVTAEPPAQARAPSGEADEAREERVRMTRLRQTIARRLKDAQNTAAMLTTFNEVDMSAVMGMRNEYKELFEKRYGVRLGFMGFFVKACIQALKEIPEVNAEIDGSDIIYKNYYHVGIAVGTDRGLVVPVVRDAQDKSLAQVEEEIDALGKRARDGELTIDEMQGGTFTISNGGVYGSLLSTPILNVPQAGILGMHKIQDRPVAVDGQVEVRPMMYLALSYDHRLVDGKAAVTFLVRVKESLEDPQRLILGL